jgi:hypothetical protein
VEDVAMIRCCRALLFAAALLAGPTTVRAAEPVDLLLVLAADVSRSIDQAKFQLQRDGYVPAVTGASRSASSNGRG